ncbi:hypothetical protein F6X37_06085 [Paraburkholderia sp. 31.1]|nr:hypothetical protein [Paraburkholderia sp. 31.1]
MNCVEAHRRKPSAVERLIRRAPRSFLSPVTMTLTAPAGSNNAQVFIDPPTSSSAGVRSQQAAYLSATHYCPSLAILSGAKS